MTLCKHVGLTTHVQRVARGEATAVKKKECVCVMKDGVVSGARCPAALMTVLAMESVLLIVMVYICVSVTISTQVSPSPLLKSRLTACVCVCLCVCRGRLLYTNLFTTVECLRYCYTWYPIHSMYIIVYTYMYMY